MKMYIYSLVSGKLLGYEERNPKHGYDFCENCGSCLHCEGNRICYVEDGEKFYHEWIQYEDDKDESEKEFRKGRNERRKEKAWN